jgi:hypothetical protein
MGNIRLEIARIFELAACDNMNLRRAAITAL